MEAVSCVTSSAFADDDDRFHAARGFWTTGPGPRGLALDVGHGDFTTSPCAVVVVRYCWIGQRASEARDEREYQDADRPCRDEPFHDVLSQPTSDARHLDPKYGILRGDGREIAQWRANRQREVFAAARGDAHVFLKDRRSVHWRHRYELHVLGTAVGNHGLAVRELKVLDPIRNRPEH